MNGITLPTTFLASFLLAVLALVLNHFSPGGAALVGALAALLFLKFMILGR